MKKIIYYISLILLLIPLVGFADDQNHVLGLNGVFDGYSGCGADGGWGISHLCQRYSVDGENATCLDPNLASPDFINVYEKVDTSKTFGSGLIAMANYAENNKISEADQAHAYRIFTMKVNFRPEGDVIGAGTIRSIREYSPSGSNNFDPMLKVGLCAAEKGYCDDINVNDYLPGSSSSGDGELSVELKKIDQDVMQSGKSFIVTANVQVSSTTGLTIKGCKADGLSCSISQNNIQDGNGTIQVKVSGSSSNKESVNVYIQFKGAINDADKITEIELYTCDPYKGICVTGTHSNRRGPYQRFIKLGKGNDITSGGENYITIDLPSLCDDPNLSDDELLANGCCSKLDGSKFDDNSKEQDTYIKYCGPVVHRDYECGSSDSCGENSYKAFSHSYVRLRNMDYMIEDYKKGADLNEFKDYLDYSVNSYCGAYTTEKLDILTPATAASVSGQFFVFDSYNSTDYNNINAYFRQPYVVERVKSTLFFNYNSWKANYDNAVSDEDNKYNAWQDAVKNVKSAFEAWQDAKKYIPIAENNLAIWNNASNRNYYPFYVCIKGKNYNENECYNRKQKANDDYNGSIQAESKAHDAYKKSISAEKTARNAYRSAVNKRTNLQGAREECRTAIESFESKYKFTFESEHPGVDFTYSQTSQKEGKTTTTINMVDNTSPVKYWPNTTTGSSNNAYDGIVYASSKGKFETSRSGDTVGTCDDNSCNLIQGGYTLGSSQDIDGCTDKGRNNKCKSYDYTDGISYSSIQGTASPANDPYNQEINLTSKETISKIFYFRPPNNTFALMNSGEYKTLNYESNAAHSDLNGLEVGYVYNIELTTYKGSYETSFSVYDYGYKTSNGVNLIQTLLKKFNLEDKFDLKNNNLTSTCSYCNMEMAFKRNCDVCDPNDPTTYDFEPQFYYRSISLSDVTPNEREGETNWTDAKGTAAKTQIELGSGIANSETIKNNNEYVALANGNDYSKDGKISTYLADSSNVGKHDIYDDGTREYLEYEVTLTTKDMQMIKRNSSRSYFNYAKMNMCAGFPKNVKDDDEQYCFKCNGDMKECESSFVTSFFSDTTGRSKWKYYVNGQYCVGNIKTCIKGLDYTMVDSKGQIVSDLDGIYPDPLFPKQFLERYKNWP